VNFILEYKKGQQGGNIGIPLGKGLVKLAGAINGLQRGRIYSIASGAKVGKSTLVDYAFLINPWLSSLENKLDLEWIYNSYEIDRVSKEFDFVAHFLHEDYGIENIVLEDGVKKNGESTIPLSPDYLRGRVLDDEGKVILVKESIFEAVKQTYSKRIKPLFGEYNEYGHICKKGAIDFKEERNNPTGVYKFLLAHAESNGQFIKTKAGGQGERIIGYKPNNPQKYVIVITDHLRKFIPEQGFTPKQLIDKFVEYSVIVRNLCQYTFVHIIHTNRSIVDQDRLRYAKDMLYPTAEDVKDTNNLSEDSDYLFTMMNPNDDKYHLKSHFGMKIRDGYDNQLYPNMRSIHLVESRHTIYPQHFKVNMFGNFKTFKPLTEII